MNLPNLFMADLGPEAGITPQMVRDACFALRRNRDAWLARQRTRQLIDVLAYTADQWREPDNGFRMRALRDGPRELGMGRTTLERGIDAFLRALSYDQLDALVVQDLGDTRRLDEFSGGAAELRTGRTSFARGPELLAHLTAGNLPVSALNSLVLGVLAKSAQFFKCARGSSWLPRLFAHSLAFNEPKLGACFEFVEWPGGSRDLEEILFHEADCVTATGGDEMLRDVRSRVPLRSRFVGYGHRVSFVYVGHELLSSYSVRRVAREVAHDATAWNQLGCLSPHVVYVQEDGAMAPEGFAGLLAEELARIEASDPRGEVGVGEAAAIQARRTVYAMRASMASAHGERPRHETAFRDGASSVKLWHSEGTTAWTVVYDADPRFEASCLNRFVYVKPVRRFDEMLRHAEPVRHHVSTVALAVAEGHLGEMALQLARWGVPRVCPVGRMQEPPLAWRHDGRPALADLLTFTDLES
ncbi:MAG: hypothetical protein DVB31_13720 [Verrucomicrobia bacterium]|nr:MAG: hypothetical protein DVB31_13720 [Verrucomicrobiota bacterium]